MAFKRGTWHLAMGGCSVQNCLYQNSNIKLALRSLNSPATQKFVQKLAEANNKESFNAQHYWPFVRRLQHWLVEFPHKGLVMQKTFPSHDIIMQKGDVASCCGWISDTKLFVAWPQMSLTHWGRDKIDAILQTTFSNAISWMKMFEFRLKFHWSLFLRVQ